MKIVSVFAVLNAALATTCAQIGAAPFTPASPLPVGAHPDRHPDCLLPVFLEVLGEGWDEGETGILAL